MGEVKEADILKVCLAWHGSRHVLQAAVAAVPCMAVTMAVADLGTAALATQGREGAPPIEKPKVVKTHLQERIILPQMMGSMVSMCNSKPFTQLGIKPKMNSHDLGEFSVTYKSLKHGWPSLSATHSSRN